MNGKIKITEAMLLDLAILIFLGILIASSFYLPSRTKRLPLLIASVTIVLTLSDVIIAVYKQLVRGEESLPKRKPLEHSLIIKTVGSIGFMIATVICWQLFGFIVTSIVVTIAFALFMGAKNKIPLVISSIVLTLALYYVFGMFLHVPLPRGTLFSWLF